MLSAIAIALVLAWLTRAVGQRLAGQVPVSRPSRPPRRECWACPLIGLMALDQAAAAHQGHPEGMLLDD